MSTQQSNNTEVEEIPNQLIEDASRFLVKVLRHSPDDYNIQLNGRGWASEKDVRSALAHEFDSVVESKSSSQVGLIGSVTMIEAILDADSKNRFQRMSAPRNAYGMIRATRNHSVDLGSLIPINMESSAFNTYKVEYPDGRATAFVVAENKKVADKLYREEILSTAENQSLVANIEKYADYPIEDAESLLGPDRHHLISQDPSQPRSVEWRTNASGSGSLYQTRHPYRFRERLPDNPSPQLE